MACDSSTGPGGGFLLTVAGPVMGVGTIQSEPPGINCQPDCTEEFPDGQGVRLVMKGTPSWRFTGWSGACTSTDTVCNVTMTSPVSVQAHFTQTPLPPGNFTAVAISPWEVELSWIDQSTTETDFRIEERTSIPGLWDEFGTVPANTGPWGSGRRRTSLSPRLWQAT